MTSQTLLREFDQAVEQRPPIRIPRSLHSPEHLQAVLKRERLRTDRNGDPFCWVIFDIQHPGTGDLSLQRLANVIASRARFTDEIGWRDERSIGVILPATAREGAGCFAADVARLAGERHLYPDVTIQVYPAPPDTSSKSAPKSGSRSGSEAWVTHDVPARGSFLAEPISWHKRLTDIVGSAVGLVMASPILLAAALAVKCSSTGSVFFGQRRAGLGGRPFTIYKFRSMYVDAESRKAELSHLNEQDGPAFKIKNDPRITSVGRFLRATSIDELPQLFNVLKGDMSLVGPRPPTFDEVAKYHRWYLRRLDVTPGLTCIWQVMGRSRVSFEEWMRMDLKYIDQHSFWLDVQLIVKTLPALLLRRGF